MVAEYFPGGSNSSRRLPVSALTESETSTGRPGCSEDGKAPNCAVLLSQEGKLESFQFMCQENSSRE